MIDHTQAAADIAAADTTEPDNPYAELGWEELRAGILATDQETAAAQQQVRDRMHEVEAELKPWRQVVSDLATRGRQMRSALKAQAVQNYRAHRQTIGKTWGGIKLRFVPRVIVHDTQRAVLALDGLVLINPETGEQTPLVVYQPVIDMSAVKQFIQANAAAHADQPDLPHLTPATEGWPGVVTLTGPDDVDSWTLAIEHDGETPRRPGIVT